MTSGASIAVTGAPDFTTLQPPFGPPLLAARVDPYVPKVRVIVLTDIANEPDDQMSMVRFLVYSNQFDVEGLPGDRATQTRLQPVAAALHDSRLVLAHRGRVLRHLLQGQPHYFVAG